VEGASDRTIVYEAVPWLKWVMLGLALTAMAMLIAGVASSINALRSRPAQS
jgi:hypothetical protein